MDRKLILAVAGSGKSSFIIGRLNLAQRFLLVTYTENNVANLRQKIIRKFGYEPNNITLLSYFQFLIRVCYRPFLKDVYQAKGICWNKPASCMLKVKRDDTRFFMSQGGYLYHNRLSKLCNDNCLPDIRERLERFYDCFMFDEVQDLGGHDFNFITALLPLNINVLFVGDFYQHTFDTSSDGMVNKTLYNRYGQYIKKWKNTNLLIDMYSLNRSYRCSPTICRFVTEQLGISMTSHRSDEVQITMIEEEKDALRLYNDQNIVKLFLQESYKYNCYALNWGASKGLDDFLNVCVVLNSTTLKAFKTGNLSELSSVTRNKLYVACTRAKGNVYFIPYNFVNRFKR